MLRQRDGCGARASPKLAPNHIEAGKLAGGLPQPLSGRPFDAQSYAKLIGGQFRMRTHGTLKIIFLTPAFVVLASGLYEEISSHQIR